MSENSQVYAVEFVNGRIVFVRDRSSELYPLAWTAADYKATNQRAARVLRAVATIDPMIVEQLFAYLKNRYIVLDRGDSDV